ncbi:hypothetical protein [Litorimonas sp.]|uniref:hypothetical protein n=1 Tax=Litorimonas sp. TaxID=1892381 RepID=UPI003A8571D0
MTWWKPGKKVGPYLLNSKVDDFPNFFEKHYVENDLSMRSGEEITHSFTSRDEAFSLCVTHGIIDSVRCRQTFVVETNIIGKHLALAIVEIVNRFGLEKAKFTCDDQIIYQDGDVQMDINFDGLAINITINLEGTILSVGAISFD